VSWLCSSERRYVWYGYVKESIGGERALAVQAPVTPHGAGAYPCR
jgi:hypothetical protein